MGSYCHRCHGELLQQARDVHNDEDILLFCPHCAAPQLQLPAHMQVTGSAESPTTGEQPPPLASAAKQVDWRMALSSGLIVALIAAALTLTGLQLPAVALLGTLWVLSSGVIALGIYRKRIAKSRLDGRVGLRLGIVTGILVLAAIGITGAITGLVLRFGTNAMIRFDEQSARQTKATQDWMVALLARQGQDQATQARYLEMLNSPLMKSPEMKAGGELASLTFEGALILLLCGAGGAFAGMLQGRQRHIGNAT